MPDTQHTSALATRALQVASRVDAIEPFRVMEMVKQAAAMRRAGIDVISMSVGEPDFTAPEMVAQAAVDAIRGGATQYTESLGLPALRELSVQDRGLVARSLGDALTTGTAVRAARFRR